MRDTDCALNSSSEFIIPIDTTWIFILKFETVCWEKEKSVSRKARIVGSLEVLGYEKKEVFQDPSWLFWVDLTATMPRNSILDRFWEDIPIEIHQAAWVERECRLSKLPGRNPEKRIQKNPRKIQNYGILDRFCFYCQARWSKQIVTDHCGLLRWITHD